MFQNILGQSYARRVLENALAGDRLAGAYLFVGPDGVGKGTAARQFAKSLCGLKSDSEPAAQAIDAGTNPDVRSVSPVGPSRIIRIGQLWPREGDRESTENAMLRDLSFQPMRGSKRVFLIYDAEGLNDVSGNSLLKSLEEPPRYAHFILTATSTAAVLPTIVSRCQIVHFGLLTIEAVQAALETRFGVAPAQAHFLAACSEGRLGRAAALARSPALLAGREALLDLARDLVNAPPIQSFKLSEEFRKLAPKLKSGDDEEGSDEKEKGTREAQARALDLLAVYYRDLLSAALLGPLQAGLVNGDRRPEILELASRLSVAQLERALELILAVKGAIERNANAQLAIDVLFTHLTMLEA